MPATSTRTWPSSLSWSRSCWTRPWRPWTTSPRPAACKLLGDRHVTGDLSGLLRLRFDLPGQRPSRFRIVCRLAEHNSMIEVLAIGERAEHAVYRDVLTRLDDPDQNSDGEP